MHYLHLIAVEVDNHEEAVAEAESAVEPFGDGRVWDWYEVGGRWEGYFDGKDSVCCGNDPDQFQKALEWIEQTDAQECGRLVDELAGNKVAADEVPDYYLGIPVQDKEGYAQRTSEDNCNQANVLRKLLKEGVPALDDRERLRIGVTLYDLGGRLLDRYTSDSHYYDAVGWSSDTRWGRWRRIAGHSKCLVLLLD
jgi:hypothetical protein